MNGIELRRYLQAQLVEIERFQRLESARCGCVIGLEQAAMLWIERFGAEFRGTWHDDARERLSA